MGIIRRITTVLAQKRWPERRPQTAFPEQIWPTSQPDVTPGPVCVCVCLCVCVCVCGGRCAEARGSLSAAGLRGRLCWQGTERTKHTHTHPHTHTELMSVVTEVPDKNRPVCE